MDHHEDAAGLEHVEGETPVELKQLTAEELNADFWDSPTCRRCLSHLHPELVEPAHNEAQAQPIDDHVSRGEVILHNSPADLADGISQGCWCCIWLFDEIRQLSDAITTIEDLFRQQPNSYSTIHRYTNSSYFSISWLIDSFDVSIRIHRKDWIRSSRGFPFTSDKINARSDQSVDYLPSYMYQLKESDGSTGSYRSMHHIATQIRNCTETHDSCAQLSNSTWYPRRLLQILSAENDDITALRVVETPDDKTVNGPYVTLSYRWGGKLNLRLLTNNYEKFCNTGIPLADIPQLFLDTAFAALKFGASYIWIDALCIIQDSKDDWLQESATMHRVYQNGLCNIMAVSAAHSGEPLFRIRDHRLTEPCIIRDNDSRKISTYSRDDPRGNLGPRRVLAGQLYRRAWVLQERLLSTRRIIFTQDNIHFECPHGAVRATLPWNSHHTFLSPDSQFFLGKVTRKNCFQKWRGTITMYGYTNLSYPEDTLVAISGLAKKIKEVHSSRYLYGVWEADLFQDLVWIDRTGERSLGFSAPSWSWASVRRPYYPSKDRSLGGVLKSLPMARDDRIQLQGPMFSISTDTSSSPFDDNRIQELIGRRMGLPSSGCPSPPSVNLDGRKAGREERPLPGTLLCLPLAFDIQQMFYDGILLAPVTGAWGVYRRVGWFQINFENNKKYLELREESPSDCSVGEDGTQRDSDGNPEAEGDAECYPKRLWALCMRRPGDVHYHDYDEVTKLHTIVLV